MAQEGQHQRCSNSSSGGGGGVSRPSKKQKQKKDPQRGLGVAQLEKIRLEEEQNKDGAAAAVVASSPCVFVPLPHHHHHHQSSNSIPFPPPSLTDLSASNALFRRSPSMPLSNFDPFSPPPPLSTTTLYGHNSSNQAGGCGGGGGAPAMAGSAETVAGHGYFPTTWNPCEFNQDGEVPKLDPGLAFRSHLQNETNPIWPPLVMMQRKQQPASMVNVSSSTSSSSGLNLQMEPPSNQSYYSNHPPPLWPEEEKIVGMKRPRPFSLDNPLGSLFQCKFPPFIPPICRSDESSSCGNGGAFSFDPGNAIFREGLSSSTAFHVDWIGGSSEVNPKKVIKENGALDGTFLTLGPPPIPSSSTTPKAKQPFAFPASNHRDFSEFDTFQFQGNTGDPFFRPGGSVQQLPFYSFFPPKGQQIGRLTTNSNDRRGEIGDGLDLNLKL